MRARRRPASAPPGKAGRLDEATPAPDARASGSLAGDFERQNHELRRVLGELQARQQELTRVHRELEDTNRGVVALYAELNDRAEHLRHASELTSKFLSNTTHEFRTPVNSILGLCDLLDRRGQFEETAHIRQAARDLRQLVDDLLDLAKVGAGKTVVQPSMIAIGDLLGALRGMLTPLLRNPSVALVFDAEPDLPPLFSDGVKVSQILRNLISNALKFTERGEVRVSVRRQAGDTIAFLVADTGPGIAPADQARIFEEYAQVGGHVLPRDGGTGLGLPLARRLAELLGGGVAVRSAVGAGAMFILTLPLRLDETRP